MTLDVRSAAAQGSLPPYLRDVVSHHAPTIIAEVYNSPFYNPPPEAWDHILAIDFDGDESGANNYADVLNGYVTDGRPTVYFSIVETGSRAESGYFFIGFYFYHPRDAGLAITPQGSGAHEHDLEGSFLIVKKSWYSPYGVIVTALTEAHGALIPFKNPSSPVPLQSPAGDQYMGVVQFWNEATFNVDRPVVAIRSRKHGTYMAQDCSVQGWQWDGGYGMWLNSPQSLGYYQSCIHGDGSAIVYVPVPLNVPPSSGIGAGRLGRNVDHGTFWYRLVELVDSPIWSRRIDSNVLLWNNYVLMENAGAAYDSFTPSDPFGALSDGRLANPPWQWAGGSGANVGGNYWYSFGVDNTYSFHTRRYWPTSPTNGLLVVNPAREAAIRFPWLPELGEPNRYNPYLNYPPQCCSSYALSAKMDGPDVVDANATNSWQAVAIGGTPPYSYQWSGGASGTDQSVSAVFASNTYLYLDVYDGSGQHVAVSKYVQLSDNPPPDPPCGGAIMC